jgi:hypothetical protein
VSGRERAEEPVCAPKQARRCGPCHNRLTVSDGLPKKEEAHTVNGLFGLSDSARDALYTALCLWISSAASAVLAIYVRRDRWGRAGYSAICMGLVPMQLNVPKHVE